MTRYKSKDSSIQYGVTSAFSNISLWSGKFPEILFGDFSWNFWLVFILHIISKTDFCHPKSVLKMTTTLPYWKSVLEIMSCIKPDQKFQEKSPNKIPGNFQDQSQIFENALVTPYCILLRIWKGEEITQHPGWCLQQNLARIITNLF